ncbi:MAG: MFS transporter [Nitrospinota bacterium]
MKKPSFVFSSRQWTVIASCFIILGLGSSLNFNFGIFIKPLLDEFSWSRSAISAGFSIFMLAGSGSAILAGGLADRYGARYVVFGGTFLIVGAMYFASRLQNILEFYLLVGAVTGLGRSAFNTPVIAYIQRSFTRNRGLATGLAGAGGGLGILLTAPLIGYFIASFGWRLSYMAIGAVVLALAIPAVLLLRPMTESESGGGAVGPRHREVAPLPEAAQGMSQIVRRRSFWTVLGSHTTDCMCHSILLVHIVPFAIESGIPRFQAAMLMSALGAGALLGRLFCGVLSDRIGPKKALFSALIIQTLPIPLLLFSPTLPVLYLVTSLAGLGIGGHGTMYPLVTREFYGPKRVGLLVGTFTSGASVGMAAGGFLGGVLYDLAGNYTLAFVFSFAIGVVSLFLVWIYPDRKFLPAGAAGAAGVAQTKLAGETT